MHPQDVEAFVGQEMKKLRTVPHKPYDELSLGELSLGTRFAWTASVLHISRLTVLFEKEIDLRISFGARIDATGSGGKLNVGFTRRILTKPRGARYKANQQTKSQAKHQRSCQDRIVQ
jgi:hypothetical protein